MDCSNVVPESEVQDDVALEMMPSKKDGHGLSEMAINKLTTLCGSNAEFKRRMEYALELAEKRNVKDLPSFLYKAIEQDYRKRDADIRAAVEREVLTLHRETFGSLALDEALPCGQWRELTEAEASALYRDAQMEEKHG